jgi:GGDEF domain-containing protein
MESKLLPGGSRTKAAPVIGKIVKANAVPLRHDGREIRATVSAGAASCPEDARDGEALRKLADRAMYAAKTRGGNRCVFHAR